MVSKRNWTPYFFRNCFLLSLMTVDMYWIWPSWEGKKVHNSELVTVSETNTQTVFNKQNTAASHQHRRCINRLRDINKMQKNQEGKVKTYYCIIHTDYLLNMISFLLCFLFILFWDFVDTNLPTVCIDLKFTDLHIIRISAVFTTLYLILQRMQFNISHTR